MITKTQSIKELWQYRELFYFMVWRDVKVRYKQSMLGALWAVIQPFGTMLVFTLFFHKLAKMPSDGIPYPIFSFSALLPWTYFSGAITKSGLSLVSNSDLLTKVYFPRITIPAAGVICGLVDFSIAFVLLLGMMAYYHMTPSWSLLLWPVLVIPLVTLALGVGMIFAALNVKYRDVQHVLPFLVQLWLFASPIIYPNSMIPERWRFLMALNPLSGLIQAFRAVVVPGRAIDWSMFGTSMAITVVIFAIGAWYFRKAARDFADIV